MDNLACVISLRASLAVLADTLRGGPKSTVAVDDLRQQVHAVVDEFRGLGWPPERVLIAIKRMCGDAGLHHSDYFPTPAGEAEQRNGIRVVLTSWCIERYYDGT